MSDDRPIEEFDPETGRWLGICDRCGSTHDNGMPPGTLGGDGECLRRQALLLGADVAELVNSAVQSIQDRNMDALRHTWRKSSRRP